ncbi:MAG TPA: thioredoxin domain-containing protein [Gemmatimonadales bacterium]|nr:thioredoxin domain-containing protein [Gemmatimonadales bacterium]
MSANRLGAAASAYLRSAAHQPIHWYPWGPEAFAAARAEGKPVLLDIGAVWCHWCHVMDGESYEDPAVAELLNRDFVCIKVDRDERPDVDTRYQRAVQVLTQQGGWPLTVFLTPDGEVFYGGTYFPPDGKYGRPGFRTVLASVLEAWRDRRPQVDAQARAIRRVLDRQPETRGAGEPAPGILDDAVDGMLRVFDPVHGGFGRQPKFPHPAALSLLLSRWWDEPRPEIRAVVERTLDAMADGGIHDHLGGGFHRYSVDAEWIVPHFEKLSYDNSELLRVYLDAYASFGTARYADVARGVVRWVREVLADPEGGYGASQDADVGLDDDGDYFTWTRDEAAAVLSAEELDLAAAYYDIGTAGEMHHNPAKNVLHVATPLAAAAARLGYEDDVAAKLLGSAEAKLRAARERRTTPFVDRTRYAGWNAMMASALLRAGAVLDDRWAEEHALRTLSRLRAEAPEGDAVAHTPAGGGGLVDDQVQVAAAALDAYEATGDDGWLEWAERIMERVWREYRDPDAGGLFDRARTGSGEGLLPAGIKPIEDAPAPSANGVAAIVCGRLHQLTGGDEWQARTAELLGAFAGRAGDLGLHAATWLLALDRQLKPATHYVVTGAGDNPEAAQMHRAALATFAPRRAVQRVTPETAQRRTLPRAVAAMAGRGPRAIGYACIGAACDAPAESLAAWRAALSARNPRIRFEAPSP